MIQYEVTTNNSVNILEVNMDNQQMDLSGMFKCETQNITPINQFNALPVDNSEMDFKIIKVYTAKKNGEQLLDFNGKSYVWLKMEVSDKNGNTWLASYRFYSDWKWGPSYIDAIISKKYFLFDDLDEQTFVGQRWRCIYIHIRKYLPTNKMRCLGEKLI